MEIKSERVLNMLIKVDFRLNQMEPKYGHLVTFYNYNGPWNRTSCTAFVRCIYVAGLP
jgi:hypothetical protein